MLSDPSRCFFGQGIQEFFEMAPLSVDSSMCWWQALASRAGEEDIKRPWLSFGHKHIERLYMNYTEVTSSDLTHKLSFTQNRVELPLVLANMANRS